MLYDKNSTSNPKASFLLHYYDYLPHPHFDSLIHYNHWLYDWQFHIWYERGGGGGWVKRRNSNGTTMKMMTNNGIFTTNVHWITIQIHKTWNENKIKKIFGRTFLSPQLLRSFNSERVREKEKLWKF